jgi:UDP-N-acetylmuramyl pentapeptide phosphotransferase/UDP-N-acetylglucosamine-1-phosphate transferase
MPFYIILALSAFMISLLGTRLIILALRKRRVPSLPGRVVRAPKGGGIAVVMGLIICLLVADLSASVYTVVLALLLLAAVSLLDDLIGLPLLVRLLVQVMSVSVVLSTLPSPVLWFLPGWLDKCIIGLVWLWFINLFNFLDDIDGMSVIGMFGIGSGLCLLAVFSGTFPTPLSIYGLIIASSACGFVWWSWNPAKILMGDVGSIPIGFFLGYLLLLAATTGYGYAALILPAYYLADGLITLGSRLHQRKKIFITHTEHYCQKALANGRSPNSVSRYIAGTNILLIFLAQRTLLEPNLAIFYLGLSYLVVFMLLGFFAYHKSPPGHAI